MDINYV